MIQTALFTNSQNTFNKSTGEFHEVQYSASIGPAKLVEIPKENNVQKQYPKFLQATWGQDRADS